MKKETDALKETSGSGCGEVHDHLTPVSRWFSAITVVSPKILKNGVIASLLY